jgi:hypothetical protein
MGVEFIGSDTGRRFFQFGAHLMAVRVDIAGEF